MFVGHHRYNTPVSRAANNDFLSKYLDHEFLICRMPCGNRCVRGAQQGAGLIVAGYATFRIDQRRTIQFVGVDEGCCKKKQRQHRQAEAVVHCAAPIILSPYAPSPGSTINAIRGPCTNSTMLA